MKALLLCLLLAGCTYVSSENSAPIYIDTGDIYEDEDKDR